MQNTKVIHPRLQSIHGCYPRSPEVDHAVNFNWLVLIDTYSKYPIIHQTTSTSSKATIQLLEEDFAHFGFPHTIVSDNATSFSSGKFQSWCQEHGITHLAGAPYHPATNGAAERLVQSFKKSLQKSSLLPKSALQEFLMMYRRTPLASGLSPSEILNGHQIRSLIDILKPSPVHIALGRQSQTTRAETTSSSSVAKVLHSYKAGTPVYTAYYGPRNDKDPRWVPAIVKKLLGARTILVHVCPRGPVWKCHIEQLRPCYGADQDADPGEVTIPESTTHPPLQNPAPSVVPDMTAQPPLQIPGPAEPMS